MHSNYLQLNFLVFGMQDPHLKRSLMVALYFFGFGWGDLKTTAVDKTVMFGGEKLIRR
jgi:hypothetical protein